MIRGIFIVIYNWQCHLPKTLVLDRIPMIVPHILLSVSERNTMRGLSREHVQPGRLAHVPQPHRLCSGVPPDGARYWQSLSRQQVRQLHAAVSGYIYMPHHLLHNV